ncbi:MAG: ferritin [Ignavibacteria bacterium]|nr:MAG: ferritin [Ignavibacteria bacterium]
MDNKPAVTAGEVVKALQQNWRAEKESARVYREPAESEKSDRRKAVLLRLAEAEERHASRWEKRLLELGAGVPATKDDLGKRLRRWINRHVSTEIAIKRLEAEEDKDKSRYEAQQARALGGDSQAPSILQELAREEKAHARVLQNLAPVLGPGTALDLILKRERWHVRSGSWIADAIYGVNDGLGAVFGIVSGVAGATNNQQHYVLISGLAGMIASALSMGAGAYLAVKSQREVYEAEISRERREVEEDPEEETEEMALFYQLQGFEAGDARKMAEKLARDPDQMVKAMAQYELGLSEQRFPSPWKSSLSAAVSTAVGAFIPIVPFFFLNGFEAVVVAFGVSIFAHFVVGAAKSILTTRNWVASGLEMTLVGVLEAAVTYGLGLMIGTAG